MPSLLNAVTCQPRGTPMLLMVCFALLLVFTPAAFCYADSEYAFLFNLDTNAESFTQSAPWQFSLEVNNTGFDDAEEVREVVAIQKTGWLGEYDYLALDYESDGFDEYHSASFQYDSDPLFNQWFINAEGFYSQENFDHPGTSQEANDITWGMGLYWLEMKFSAHWSWQWGIGGRWQTIDSEVARIFENQGKNDYFLPGLKFQFQNIAEGFSDVKGFILFEWNQPSIANTKALERNLLVPVVVDSQVRVVDAQAQVDLPQRFKLIQAEYSYLYHFSNNHKNRLLQQFKWRASGFYGFGDALLPHFQRSVGGLYSVRGYDEQVASGDTVIELSAEYRFSPLLLQSFAATVKPWITCFVDWADIHRNKVRVQVQSLNGLINTQRETSAESMHLYSFGLGLDINYQNQSIFYIAWARALADDGVSTEKGDHQVHAYLRFYF